jgi:hypothetical protein
VTSLFKRVTPPVRLRVPNAGPAFIPMRKTTGEDVWADVDLSREAGTGHTVVSGASDGAAWSILTKRFANDCAAAPNAARTVFFRLREPRPGSYQASCVYFVVGPYAEVRDPDRGLVTIATPGDDVRSASDARVNQ